MFLNRVHHFGILILIATLLTMTVSPKNSVGFQTEEVKRAEQDSLDRPAHLLVYVEKEGLKLFSIPAANDDQQEIQSHIIKRGFNFHDTVLGVFGGHLLTRTGGELLATDLTDGDIRKICFDDDDLSYYSVTAAYASGHLYSVVKLAQEKGQHTHALCHMDLHTMKGTTICNLSSRCSTMQFNRPRFTIKASPDGQRVAVSEMQPKSKKDDKLQSLFAPPTRIVIGQAGKSKAIQTEFTFESLLMFTGGGDYFAPPTFAWADNDMLLTTVSNEQEERKRLGMTGGGTPVGFKVPWELKSINARSGKVESFFRLPSKYVKCRFLESQVSQPILETTGTDIRLVNVNEKNLSEPFAYPNQYRLKPNKIQGSYSLSFKNGVQEIHTKFRRVFPSSNGKRIAWFALKNDLGSIPFRRKNDHSTLIHENCELKIHDPVHGVRTLDSKWFGGSSGYLCRWINDSELERSKHLDAMPNANKQQ